MTTRTILNRWNDKVAWSGEPETVKDAIHAAHAAGANLAGADLTLVRDDIWAVLSAAPRESVGLLAAIQEGRINGSCYEGACACLVGTIASVAGVNYQHLPVLKPNTCRPAEKFFLAIDEGDTPETSQFSKLASEWVEQWIVAMRSAFTGDRS